MNEVRMKPFSVQAQNTRVSTFHSLFTHWAVKRRRATYRWNFLHLSVADMTASRNLTVYRPLLLLLSSFASLRLLLTLPSESIEWVLFSLSWTNAYGKLSSTNFMEHICDFYEPKLFHIICFCNDFLLTLPYNFVYYNCYYRILISALLHWVIKMCSSLTFFMLVQICLIKVGQWME